MFSRAVWAVSAVLLTITPAVAKDCPLQNSSPDAREEAIRKAPSCRQAYDIMEACAYGATGDTGLGDALRERCEPEFLPKLSKMQRRLYDRTQKRCDEKHARLSGTMYRSMAAFCRARSTAVYAARYGRPAKAKN